MSLNVQMVLMIIIVNRWFPDLDLNVSHIWRDLNYTHNMYDEE